MSFKMHLMQKQMACTGFLLDIVFIRKNAVLLTFNIKFYTYLPATKLLYNLSETRLVGTRDIMFLWRNKTNIYLDITKTRLYNLTPLYPTLYSKTGIYRGIHYIIFHISAQNIDCGYSLEPPRRGVSNEYPQSMFWAEIWKKYQSLLSEKFQVVSPYNMGNEKTLVNIRI